MEKTKPKGYRFEVWHDPDPCEDWCCVLDNRTNKIVWRSNSSYATLRQVWWRNEAWANAGYPEPPEDFVYDGFVPSKTGVGAEKGEDDDLATTSHG